MRLRRRLDGPSVGRFRHDLVHRWIEDLHDLAVDLDAVGDIDHVLEHLADDFGNGGLAVAGRAVNQDGVAGVDRRAKAADEAIWNDQALEGLVQTLAGDDLVGDPLAKYAFLVVLERAQGPGQNTVRV